MNKEDAKRAFGENLKRIRIARGFSQDEIQRRSIPKRKTPPLMRWGSSCNMEVPFWQKETLCKRASENLTVNGGPIEGIRLEECHLYLGIP